MISFTYGPNLSGWEFWFTEVMEWDFWEFWDMVDHPERTMPGAWELNSLQYIGYRDRCAGREWERECESDNEDDS